MTGLDPLQLGPWETHAKRWHDTRRTSCRRYSFGDVRLLQLALRHASNGPCNNTQLAWLGNAVWGLLSTTDSFRRTPDASRKGVRTTPCTL